MFRALSPSSHRKASFDNVSLGELMDLSAPIRNVYREAYKAVLRTATTIQELENDKHHLSRRIESYDETVTYQSEVISELSERLLDVAGSEKFWREAARPNASSAISWTIAELALGILPFPVPTTPLAYFLDVLRYRRQVERDKDAS